MATAPPVMRPTDLERWRRALSRAGSYRDRPSSAGADEFFQVRGMQGGGGGDVPEDWRTLPGRICRLRDHLLRSEAEAAAADAAADADGGTAEGRRLALTATVFASAGSAFLPAFKELFSAGLAARQGEWDKDAEYTGDGDGPGFDEADVYSALRDLGWTATRLTRPLGEALHGAILGAVSGMVGGEFEDASMLDLITSWKGTVLSPWVRGVVGDWAFEAEEWESRLDYATSECFCQTRIGEIFDVVADYPDSLPAVHELRDALDRTRMHARLASGLKASLCRRLIHPGANTSQIISVYINTIKVLREIDPSDGLLDAVAEPVRSYLRGRGDTVRCIVTSLTDEEAGGDLYEELRRQDARPLEQAQLDCDDDGDAPDYDWRPPPSLFKQRGTMGHLSTSDGTGDILSMLVGIYGSKDLFVNEYRLMLADKLLANLNFDTDKEVHNLELLKLRFGEMSMRQCEIMIKDIDDSKRINTNIHSTIRSKKSNQGRRNKLQAGTQEAAAATNRCEQPFVDVAIVSHIFWPALQREKFKNHPRIQSHLDQFSSEYAVYKNPRRLVWLDQLGTVQIELEVVDEDGSGSHMQEFTCSTLQATLISHFEDRTWWRASELSDETGVAEDVVRKKMGYWINNRVVQAVQSTGGTTTYTITSVDDFSESERDSAGGGSVVYEEDEDEGQAVSAGAQEAEEMKVFESYVVGMLTNLGQLPLDRIHNNLKMFVSGSDHKYDKTPRQLSMFLQRLCKEQRLECENGCYQLIQGR